MKRYLSKSNVLWVLLIFTIALPIIDIFTNRMGGFLFALVSLLIIVMPVVILFLHAIWMLGWRRGLLFIVLAGVTGFIFEVIGVNLNMFFGGEYYYSSEHFGPLLWQVPIVIALYWAVFIYSGYSITNSFLAWIKKVKPTVKDKLRFNSLLALFFMVVIDAAIVVGLDLFMDPILVDSGAWTWVNGGDYFGVPIGNFIGWFVVVLIVTAIFRIIEYFWPQQKSKLSQESLLIPVFGWGTICVVFFLAALEIQLPALAMIGLLVMMPWILVSLFLFLLHRK